MIYGHFQPYLIFKKHHIQIASQLLQYMIKYFTNKITNKTSKCKFYS